MDSLIILTISLHYVLQKVWKTCTSYAITKIYNYSRQKIMWRKENKILKCCNLTKWPIRNHSRP